MHRREEALQALEAFFAFDRNQLGLRTLPRFVPASCDQGGIVRDIFPSNVLQTRLGEKTLVDSGRAQ